jgi:hypothetical protein
MALLAGRRQTWMRVLARRVSGIRQFLHIRAKRAEMLLMCDAFRWLARAGRPCRFFSRPCMNDSMNDPARRSASAIRTAFKTLTSQRLPSATALDKFTLLWDETNRAAAMSLNTTAISEYLALLREMDRWYQEQMKAPGGL